MTELANLQSLFQNHVISGDAAATAFVGNASAAADERLGVYYAAYRLRLVDILRDDFPGLCALMSTDEFATLGIRYLDKHPSTYPSVRFFGKDLAGFLETDSNYAERAVLAEMARFEWLRGLAFDAANADIMTLEELGALPPAAWPALRLQFHPSLQRAPVAWNIGPIWRAVDAETTVPQPARLEKPAQLAVWRRGIIVYWRSLDDAEACAMDTFAEGYDFAAVCSELCAWLDEEEVPVRMAGLLNQWVTEGLILK